MYWDEGLSIVGVQLEKFWENSCCFGLASDFDCDVFVSVFFDNAMLSSEFGVIDDVYSAVDRKVIGGAGSCLGGRVSRCVDWRVCSSGDGGSI